MTGSARPGLGETLGRHKELVLATVFLLVAGQEFVEIWALERFGPSSVRFWLGLALHGGQVLAILAGTFVFIRAWQGKSALTDQAVQRSAELERVIAALHEKEQALAAAMERLRVVQEEERRLVAFDIHDCVAPMIVSAKQHLDTFEALWRGQVPAAGAELERVAIRLDQAIVETRRLLAALGPTTLETLGLIPALKTLLEETGQEAGWEVELRSDVGDARLPPRVETAVYRIVQEALANAAKHARATRLTVSLRSGDGTVSVEVADTGIGFQVTPDSGVATGVGLVSMRERARLLGGTCRIDSAPAGGTTVRATIPLPDEAERADPR
jgi:signal transduction histidine kinase